MSQTGSQTPRDGNGLWLKQLSRHDFKVATWFAAQVCREVTHLVSTRTDANACVRAIDAVEAWSKGQASANKVARTRPAIRRLVRQVGTPTHTPLAVISAVLSLTECASVDLDGFVRDLLGTGDERDPLGTCYRRARDAAEWADFLDDFTEEVGQLAVPAKHTLVKRDQLQVQEPTIQVVWDAIDWSHTHLTMRQLCQAHGYRQEAEVNRGLDIRITNLVHMAICEAMVFMSQQERDQTWALLAACGEYQEPEKPDAWVDQYFPEGAPADLEPG